MVVGREALFNSDIVGSGGKKSLLVLSKLSTNMFLHWVSELECSRLILWEGQWRRMDEVPELLGHHYLCFGV